MKVKIIADSISIEGQRLTTFELEYPRMIHAEIMTHRVFSRNAQSSRAVPVARSLEMEVITPLVWGKNQSGMSSKEVLDELSQKECQYYWAALVRYCQDFAGRMAEKGLHKQWANRCLEWFSPIKVVVTATEWDNFFWLRDDEDAAQPEIVELCRQMKKAYVESHPMFLEPGMHHIPYIKTYIDQHVQKFISSSEENEIEIDLETALKVSASCCAQVSYRRLDTTVEKALGIYERLFSGPKPHLSPVEHQARAPAYNQWVGGWEPGITHVDRSGAFWSGNFKGWVQIRQLMSGTNE